MSLHLLDDHRAFPVQTPGRLDLGFQVEPNSVHRSLVAATHTFVSAAVALAVIAMAFVACIAMGG